MLLGRFLLFKASLQLRLKIDLRKELLNLGLADPSLLSQFFLIPSNDFFISKLVGFQFTCIELLTRFILCINEVIGFDGPLALTGRNLFRAGDHRRDRLLSFIDTLLSLVFEFKPPFLLLILICFFLKHLALISFEKLLVDLVVLLLLLNLKLHFTILFFFLYFAHNRCCISLQQPIIWVVLINRPFGYNCLLLKLDRR